MSRQSRPSGDPKAAGELNSRGIREARIEIKVTALGKKFGSKNVKLAWSIQFNKRPFRGQEKEDSSERDPGKNPEKKTTVGEENLVVERKNRL